MKLSNPQLFWSGTDPWRMEEVNHNLRETSQTLSHLIITGLTTAKHKNTNTYHTRNAQRKGQWYLSEDTKKEKGYKDIKYYQSHTNSSLLKDYFLNRFNVETKHAWEILTSQRNKHRSSLWLYQFTRILTNFHKMYLYVSNV